MKETFSIRSFFRYVSLNMLGMLGLSCYILADTFFIANRLGPAGLAALNLAIPVYSVVNGVGLMLGVGGATRYAVLKARGEDRSGEAVYTHAVSAALLGGLLFLLCGLFLSGPLSRLLGGEGAVLPLTEDYLKTLLSFAPFFLLNNVVVAFVRNDGAPRLAMAGMLLGSFSNILLDWVFLYGMEWGMAGAAFATGLAPILSLGLLSRHFWGKRNGLRLRFGKPEPRLLGHICFPGLSSLVSELASAAALVVFNLLLLELEGSTGVAAYGVVANLALVAAALFTGIAQGIQPIASRCHGHGDDRGERRLLGAALCLSLALAGVLCLLAVFFASPMAAAFNGEQDPRLAALAERGLRVYFLGFLFAGPNIVAAAFFSALERAGSGFAVSMVRGFAALIPLALLFARLLGTDGVWLSFPAAEACAFLLAGCLLLSWKAETSRSRRAG